MVRVQPIFSEILSPIHPQTFARFVDRYNGNRKVRTFRCWDQFLCMCFAQLTYRESLRDIESCLQTRSDLYHMGFRSPVRRSTLSEANESRDWRIYSDLAHHLIGKARKLYENDPIGVALDQPVYAIDATTIDLCLSLFPWARFRKKKAAIKMNTQLDLRGTIPFSVHITDGKTHEVKWMDSLIWEPGSIYLFDRGYLDFARLFKIDQAQAYFVIRAKERLQFTRLWANPISDLGFIRCDQVISLAGVNSKVAYPNKLRRIKIYDKETDRLLIFLTNAMDFDAATIAALYKNRWKVELFFKWIKQHLRIKGFFGTSENAVHTQIWIAIATYVLVAIKRKELGVEKNLHEIFQKLSINLFEKVSLYQVLMKNYDPIQNSNDSNQLLFSNL